jgi:hypothetical protein
MNHPELITGSHDLAKDLRRDAGHLDLAQQDFAAVRIDLESGVDRPYGAAAARAVPQPIRGSIRGTEERITDSFHEDPELRPTLLDETQELVAQLVGRLPLMHDGENQVTWHYAAGAVMAVRRRHSGDRGATDEEGL